MSDLSLGDKNFSDAGTELFIDDAPFDSNSNYMLWADAFLVMNRDIYGLIGIGGGAGPGVWAGSIGVDSNGNMVFGPGTGVVAWGNLGAMALGGTTGAFARGGGWAGVDGRAADGSKAMGVYGLATQQSAVVGDNRRTTVPNTAGCLGVTHDGFGTVGVVQTDPARQPTSGNAALLGIVEFDPKRKKGDPVTALLANAAVGPGPGGRPEVQGFAGIFNGPVAINGPLTVFGQSWKSAVVPHPDGSHRRLYCTEAPESLFEDVGRARIVSGRAEVHLDPDFAALIRTENYHVFITPEGDCHGLYVASRSPEGFSVRESQGGVATVDFSYRIVAKRKDIDAPRLEKVEPPPTGPQTFTVPEATEVPVQPPPARPVVRKGRTKAPKPRSPKRGSRSR